MNYIPKRLVFTLFIIATTGFSAFSQSDGDKAKPTPKSTSKRYFSGFRFSAFTDVIFTPYTFYPNYVTTYSGYPATTTLLGNNDLRMVEFNLTSYSYKGWVNVLEFGDNASFSLGFEPTIGLGIGFSSSTSSASNNSSNVNGPHGFGSVELPLLAEFHYGNGATYNTNKNIGFSFGAGVEFIYAPLIITDGESPSYTDQNGKTIQTTLVSGWMEPCIQAGITFWAKTNTATEVSFKYGFGSGTRFQDGQGTTVNSGGSSYQLSFMFYLGY